MLADKVAKMSQNYIGWRGIRGDGNCYYRAVYFSVFEQLIVDNRRDAMHLIVDIFGRVTFDDEREQHNHSLLMQMLMEACGNDPSLCTVYFS